MFRFVHLRRGRAVALFAALLTFQCLGWLAGWHVARQEVRWSMRQAMQEDKMPSRSVTLLATDLPRLRVDKHEIRLGGHLYDIRFQEIIGDSVRLALYHDAREERLFEVLGSLLTEPDSPASAPASPLRTWWAKWFGAAFLPPGLAPCWAFTESWPMPGFSPHLLPAAQASPACFSPPPETRQHREQFAPTVPFPFLLI